MAQWSTTAAAASACICAATTAGAVPVTVNTPFINLENRAINSIGAAPGQFVRIGAVSVTPNGNQGTTGVGTHLLAGGGTASRTINFNPSPLNPNFFQRLFTDDPSLRGDWTLTFANGTDSTSRTVNLSPSAQQVPFVNSITLSGSSDFPTFSWAPPPGVTVNAYRINIYDKALRIGNNSGQVTNRDLLPSVTSYTVSASDFSVPGNGFALGKHYAIEISLIQTKDGTSNSSNSNLQAIARTYADFTPQAGGGPVVNLPVVLANGAYQFNMAVQPGVTYYIDPDVAIGYDYAIGTGNPNFLTVDLPDSIGDGRYDIYGFDGGGAPVLLAANWLGTDVYSFGATGVERFRVMGIEPSAGLDPANTTAFVTGLTFSGAGSFTGTQTPIAVPVPEPHALWLGAIGVGVLALRRRRAQPSSGG